MIFAQCRGLVPGASRFVNISQVRRPDAVMRMSENCFAFVAGALRLTGPAAAGVRRDGSGNSCVLIEDQST